MNAPISSGSRKILVTGAAGFLGSHLCSRLLAERPNVEVLGIDNLSSGSTRNVDHLLAEPRFTFRRHDVIEPIEYTPDEIYNLACPASPVQYQLDPIHTLKTSVLGVLNMLELAGRNGARILQTSTSEVYGDPTVTPQNESYWGNVNPFGPRACYDEGKRAAETLLFDHRRCLGTEIRIVRIFNTYGSRMHPADGRVVSNFIMQALTNQPITIYGDGSQTRSFCYVDDTVGGIVRLMNHPDNELGPINIGNPNEITILELAQQVIALTGSRSQLVWRPLPQDDPMQRCPDIGRAREVLGWQPSVPLAEGLRRTIDDLESRLNEGGRASTAAE